MESKEDIQDEFETLWGKYLGRLSNKNAADLQEKMEALIAKGAVLEYKETQLEDFIADGYIDRALFYLNHVEWNDKLLYQTDSDEVEYISINEYNYYILSLILYSDKCEFYLQKLMQQPKINPKLLQNLTTVTNQTKLEKITKSRDKHKSKVAELEAEIEKLELKNSKLKEKLKSTK